MPSRTYVALRVPQADGNAQLRRQIVAGRLEEQKVRDLENQCLQLTRAYDKGRCKRSHVIDAVVAYERLLGPRVDRRDAYNELLADRPWRRCGCGLCGSVGIEIVLFRGAERNRRRGFHNLFVFARRLDAGIDPWRAD